MAFSKEKQKFSLRMKIETNFLTGLIVILPAILSIWLLNVVFVSLTDFTITQLPLNLVESKVMRILWRVIAILVIGLVILLVGIMARNYVGGKLIRLGERILERIPLFNKVYGTLKQISKSIWGDDKKVFRSVVMFEYPRAGIYSLGFITSEAKGETQDKTSKDVVNIFLPTTPNPTSGFFLMIPREDLIFLDMSIEEGIKTIISGGVLMPEGKGKTIEEK